MSEYPSYQPPSYAPVPNSGMAVASLVSGILSWVLFPLIGAIVAIITGHAAKNEIRNSAGRLGGETMANIGLVLGYAQIVLTLIGLCIGIALVGFGVCTIPFWSVDTGF